MRSIAYTFSILVFIQCLVGQQAVDLKVNPFLAPAKLLARGSGVDTLMIFCERRFNMNTIDTSHFEILSSSLTELEATGMRYRFDRPRFYLGDAEIIPGGVLFGGQRAQDYYNNDPIIGRLNGALELDWTLSFNGDIQMLKVSDVIVTSDRFIAYCSRPYQYDQVLVRVIGPLDGIDMYAQKMQLNSPGGININTSGAAAQPDRHILGGYSWHIGEHRGLVIEADTSGTTWAKIYTHGYHLPVQAIASTSDGGYVASGMVLPYPSSGAGGFVMKLDGSGNVLWSRKYMFNTGMIDLDGIRSLPDGGVLVCGHDSFNEGMIMRLDGQGTVLWAAHHTEELYDFFELDQQIFVIGATEMIGLNAAYGSCVFTGFGSHIPYTVPIAVTVADVEVLTSPHPINVLPVEHTSLGSHLTLVEQCQTTLVDRHPIPSINYVYPDPCTSTISVMGLEDDIILILDAHGRIIRQTALEGSSTDVSDLSPGIYLMQVPEKKLHMRFVKN